MDSEVSSSLDWFDVELSRASTNVRSVSEVRKLVLASRAVGYKVSHSETTKFRVWSLGSRII